MAFINERISPEDKQKHNLTDDSNFYRAGTTSWTIDRERNMFLIMRVGAGREGAPGEANWAFYWRGHLLDIRLRALSVGVDPDGKHGWEHRKVLEINGLSEEVARKRDDILADLKEALTAHQGMGIYSKLTSYEVELDV